MYANDRNDPCLRAMLRVGASQLNAHVFESLPDPAHITLFPPVGPELNSRLSQVAEGCILVLEHQLHYFQDQSLNDISKLVDSCSIVLQPLDSSQGKTKA